MEFRHVSGHFLDTKADLLAFSVHGESDQDPLFKSASAALEGLLKTLVKEQHFKGKSGESVTAYTAGLLEAKYVVVLGAGDESSFELASVRDLASRAAAIAQHLGAKSMCFAVPAVPAAEQARAAQFAVEGALLGEYKFDKYQTRDRKPTSLKRVTVAVDARSKKSATGSAAAIKSAIERGEVVARAVCRARDYINEPAGYMTPTQLASEARGLAKEHGLGVKVLGRKECERLGMGMFLAVAQGSDEEPKLIHLIYTPKGKPASKIALIGKGVMFDSGGYSIKPSQAMEDMKVDMSGAAAVISAMGAIATLGSKHEVHAIAACCENLISGRAYKLGDVLKSMDGTTVEINNTDAEGRLTLADAITYARTKVAPDEIIDFATLTGACMVALGPYTAGVMSDTEDMVQRWLEASERAGEDMWRLPLNKRLKSQLKSNIADMRNTGERLGGAITAGLFLQNFVKDSKWVHVDLAGPASVSKSKNPSIPRGGTGFAVASIVEYLTNQA
jgi:leucyl aminopeptidase